MNLLSKLLSSVLRLYVIKDEDNVSNPFLTKVSVYWTLSLEL